MTESERILSQFRTGRHFEECKAGRPATLCIAGYFSYNALRCAAEALCSDSKPVKTPRGFRFEGVRIFPSHGFNDGFYFGATNFNQP